MNQLTHKTLALAAVFCLAAVSSTLAQAGGGHKRGDWEPPSVEDRVARLAEELELNESQTASLLSIMTAADEEREAMRERHEALIRADICALKASTSAEIEGILTSEQAAEFEEIEANMEARHDRWAGHRGKHPKPWRDCEEADA